MSDKFFILSPRSFGILYERRARARNFRHEITGIKKANKLKVLIHLEGVGQRDALAVPDSELFRKYLVPVKHAFEAAGIGVFLVGGGGQVRVFTDFQL